MSGVEKTKLEIRGVREAKREGWRSVSTRDLKKATSWNQLYDWLDQNCTGQYKESFYLQEIAFEKDRDVTWFMLKWM